MTQTKATLIDLNSNELALDLDGDTTLHSSTDDQIDIKIAGADDFKFTANTFTALSGSSIVTSTLTGTGDLTVDAAGDIILDAGGANINFDDDGVAVAHIEMAGQNLEIKAKVADKAIIFKGNDGGSAITALTLDMQEAGAAAFNSTINSGAITSTGIVTGTGFTAGNAVLAEAELELLDGLTAGTAIASKVVTTDANIDTTGQRNLTITGELDAATLDISGNADIDGITNLDVVDIDGAVDMATTLTLAGNADFNGDLDVDGTTNLDVVDIDGAVNIAAAVTQTGGVFTQDGGAVFNEASADVDFRVESNGNTHMLFVDGGNNRVGVGTAPDLGVGLHIRTADSGGTANANADELILEGAGSGSGVGMGILSATDGFGYIVFGDSGGNAQGGIQYHNNGDSMRIYTNDSEAMRVHSSGKVTIGSSTEVKTLAVQQDGGGAAMGIDIHNLGTNSADDSLITFETQGHRNWSMGIDRSASSFVIAKSDGFGSPIFTIADGGATTITVADNSDTLTLKSTDTDDDVGPNLRLYRAVTGADNDSIGTIDWAAQDDGGGLTDYASITTQITDASNGSEDGKLTLKVMNAGSLNQMLTITGPETVVNEGSKDHDFRVESNGNSKMFFVDGGNDAVIFNGNSSDYEASSQAVQLHNTGLHITSGYGIQGGVNADRASINLTSGASGHIVHKINNSEIARITSTGLGIGTSSPSQLLDIVTSDNAPLIEIRSTVTPDGSKFGGGLVLGLSQADDSGSGANDTQAGDTLGRIIFEGQGTDFSYNGSEISTVVTVGDGNDGRDNQATALVFKTIAVGGNSSAETVRFSATENVFNEASADIDFRVESNGDTHALFVDGGNNRVGIGTSSPDYTLHVRSMGSPSNDTIIDIEANATDGNVGIQFTNSGGTLKGRILYDTDDNTLATTVDTTEVQRYLSGGQFLINRTSSNQNDHDNGKLERLGVTETSAQRNNLYLSNTSASYGSYHQRNDATRAAHSGYGFFIGSSGNESDNEIRMMGDGSINSDGANNLGSGADYAEYFEWKDGNSSDEDRRGYSVVLDGNQIVKATDSDDASKIIGVISGNPSVVGDSAWNKWNQKHLKDDFNTYIWEDYTQTEWTDADGNFISHQTDLIPDGVTAPDDAVVVSKEEDGTTNLQRRKVNPSWDATATYIPRSDRKEWDTVGLMGKLRLKKGQPTGTNWIKMRDISDSVEEWLVR